jgi:hypothetical protein
MRGFALLSLALHLGRGELAKERVATFTLHLLPVQKKPSTGLLYDHVSPSIASSSKLDDI